MSAIPKTAGTAIYTRLPYEKYCALPGLRISALKELVRSPLNYRFRAENPKESKALLLGSAAHTAILEPHRFLAEYALWDERTDDGKVRPRRGKDWDAFAASNGDKRIVRADEHELAMAMRDAVRGNSLAMRYLRYGDSEVSIMWTDEETGRAMKCRTDWLTKVDGQWVVTGLKTARDCRPIGFGNASAKLGYHLAWAYYIDGFAAVLGETPRAVEIVVESSAPHDVVVYRIPDDIVEHGRSEYRKLLDTLAVCEKDNYWPGVADEEQILSLPSWVYEAENDISELELED